MIFDEIQKFGDNIALVNSEGTKVSYSELVMYADKMAEHIGRRCIIFIMCRNCIESIAGYVGALRNNIVPVMLSHDIDQDLFENLYNTYKPSFIWGECKMKGEEVYSYGSYHLYECRENPAYPIDDRLALLLTTSGSTGSPKLVRQSALNLESNTESIVQYLEIVPDDKAITTLPMNYTYGLSIINTHLYVGATMILTEATLMDKAFWSLLRNEQATTFGGVPYIYEMLKKLRFSRMDLPSLRYITQAGGKLPKELAEEFYSICVEKNIKMIIMYGQTEATARMSYLPWKDASSKAGSIGIAIPGGRFELIDANEKVIDKPDVTGELVYYGDNVTLGYAENKDDLIRPDDNNGVLHTGDMAKIDEDGFYYIVGRKKRFLKLFGNRVNLDEVENLLKKEGFENVCVGTDDHMRIYITDESKTAQVRDYIVNHTGISNGGFSIHYIDQIPRNESGKVLYSSLQ